MRNMVGVIGRLFNDITILPFGASSEEILMIYHLIINMIIIMINISHYFRIYSVATLLHAQVCSFPGQSDQVPDTGGLTDVTRTTTGHWRQWGRNRHRISASSSTSIFSSSSTTSSSSSSSTSSLAVCPSRSSVHFTVLAAVPPGKDHSF